MTAEIDRDVHDPMAESAVTIGCASFGLDLSLRSTDDVAHGIEDPAAFRAGIAAIRDAAAALNDAVAPTFAAAPLELAA